jgi:choline dehydrogenase-like flavoprotein
MIIHSAGLNEDILANVGVCVVGSGAAGITLACELDGADFKVLLLEAGSLKPSAATQDYYRGGADAPHPEPDQYRRVVFGGTTRIWGGRCVPFDPIDFERRAYVAESGWPISYEEVARHYPRALEYCDAGVFDFTASGSIDRARATIAGLEAGVIESDLIERYSLPTDFGKRYRSRITDSRNVTAVLGARCLRVVKAAGEDRIESVEVAGESGERRFIRAKIFVIASGGIESTRLLLASNAHGRALGDASGRLGLYYACHLEGSIGKLVPGGAAVSFDFEKTRDGVYCRRQMRFSAQAQREHGLLNTAFRLHFPEYSDASHGSAAMSAIFLAKSALISEYRNILQHTSEFATQSPASQHLRNVLRGIPQLCRFAYDWTVRRQLAVRKLPYTLVANADGSFPLEFNCEQTPLASSRITLSGDVDVHGMPRVKLAWRRSDDDIEAMQRAFLLLRASVAGSGVSRLEFDHGELVRRLQRIAPLGGHHLGTTRMAASPQEGVVDENCAVFHLPNLYVASSSVFPTGSHANPTLTIVALALRLSARLRAAIGKG